MLKVLSSALQDGEGNVSTMRIVVFLIILSVIVPKVVLSIKTGTPITWSADDMTMIGIALGGKLVQNKQENSGTPPSQQPPIEPVAK